MEYQTVGSTGVQVSPLCFGTMSFGTEADQDVSAQMFHRVREAGINFFDTADVYGQGASEQILGKLVAGLPRRDRDHLEGVLPDRAGRQRAGPVTPIEATLRALDDLQRQGKILYPAVSNWAAWQIATALGISMRQSLARFELVEPMYNLVKRQAEVEILPLATAENLGVITYSPLGAGLLTGKYGAGKRPEGGRLVENARYGDRYGLDSDLATADRFTTYAEGMGVKPATLAVAWTMSHPAVTAPIIGARDLAQLEDSLAALDLDMTTEMREEISALSPAPAPATDRTETLKPNWT
jgi:aryl-alcohol dehydrogenase-like predicted oxidoreductase